MMPNNPADGSASGIRRGVSSVFLRLFAVFLFASGAIFLAIEAMPEDPVSLRIKNPDPERIAQIRESLGLDDPVEVRYFRVVRDFLILDWGESLFSGRSVLESVGNHLPATLELALLATFMGIAAGCSLVLTAHASGARSLLRISRSAGALGLTVPIFWLGFVLIFMFGVATDWLPVGGRINFQYSIPPVTGFLLVDTLLAGNLPAFGSALSHLVLPSLTLALYPMALVAGTLDARLSEPRLQQLIRVLRSRGLHPVRIWGLHILRLAGAPVLSVIGTQAGSLMGGAVLTETVYSWPGMGRFVVDGVINRDIPVVQNGLLLVVLLALAIVFSVDLFLGRSHREFQDKDAHG